MTKTISPDLPLSPECRLHPVMPRIAKKPRKALTASEARRRQLDREEMQSLLVKLKHLVPGIPKRRRLSKLEIIQHVIDYIFDLQTALESHGGQSPIADFVHLVTASSSSSASSASSALSQGDGVEQQLLMCTQYPNATMAMSNATLPQRIPGSNRQPLASIVL